MKRRKGWRRWVRPWRDVGSEVDDEIGYHLEMRAREHEAEGMDPEVARRMAEQRFGNVARIRERMQTEAAVEMIVDALRLACVGLGIGLVGAFATSRLLWSQLFGIQSTDPLTYVSVSVVLGMIALLAAWVPARRASRASVIAALTLD